MTEQEAFDTQLELENIAQAAGINRYRKMVTIRGHEVTQPGQRLMRMNVEPLTAEIQRWFSGFSESKRGPKARYYTIIKHLQPAALSYLTVKSVLGKLGGDTKLTTIARIVGQAIESHSAWLELVEEHGGLAHHVSSQMKEYGNEKHRKGVARHITANVAGIRKWPEGDCIAVGMVMCELLAQSTNMVEIDRLFVSNRETKYLRPTQETMDFLTDGHARCEELAPMTGPMVCPPVPWTGMYDGGYLVNRYPLIRSTSHAQLGEMEHVEMPEVYSAINAIQNTAYSVNEKVLEVVQQIWADGGGLAGIPSAELLPDPVRPADIDDNPDALAAWKFDQKMVHKRNEKMTSKRLAVMRTLRLADQFKHYDAIYFPHNLDWRGRAYPISTDLQPQGNDIAKGLLQYSVGKPIGEDGFAWLKVHIANVFGIDKVSMEDRIAWVDQNHERLINIAIDPLDGGDHLWCITDDGKPRKEALEALAACYEYAAVIFNGTDYHSKMIVAVDGSCNGLQNLSAMLRDSKGGAAVNLVPQDTPNDIYTQVAQRTQDKLWDATGEMADEWSGYLISRLLVKRAVMTKPYGVTNNGMRDQIVGLISDETSEYYPLVRGKDRKGVAQVAQFITTLIDESISEIVVASKDVMDWMKDVTRMIVARDQPVFWRTPLGFHVLQDYRNMESPYCSVYIFGQRCKYRRAMATDEINKRRSTNATSPNVVHSLDATHMMMTVNAGLDSGIHSFTMVHDSYGTHAADIGELGYILRDQFVKLYSKDVLGDLHGQFISQVGEEDLGDFPELPEYGDLDINAVMESLYFFA